MSWIMTLYSADLPHHMVKRIWDYFFVYGSRVIHQVALAILYRVQDAVVNLARTRPVEHLLRYLKTFTREDVVVGWPVEELLDFALSRFPISPGLLASLVLTMSL